MVHVTDARIWPYDEFPGNKVTALWFPNKSVAEAWLKVLLDPSWVPIDITMPTQSTSIKNVHAKGRIVPQQKSDGSLGEKYTVHGKTFNVRSKTKARTQTFGESP